MTVLAASFSLAADRLEGVGDEFSDRRAELVDACPTADALAARFDRSIVRTPAVRLVGERLRHTVLAYDGRLVVSVPPQELKTTELRWLCTWLLLADPERRIIYASYSAALARQSGRAVRSLVETHGSPYGLTLDRSHADASDWTLAGHIGGVVSVGIGGSLTGRPGDILIIDDPIRNRQDADSETIRQTLREWNSDVGRTRLAPGSPIIEVQTRWNENDLAGDLISAGWPLINIPALADGQTRDDLARDPGVYLESTRGRTREDWEAIRREVGERTWASLYQGRPAPLEGGIFKQAWFEQHRQELAPKLELAAVIVDPADTGQGDAAGILVMGRTPDGRIPVLANLSGQFSQAEWGRRACLGWLRWGAARIVQERNLGMRTTIPDAWSIIYRQATALAASPTNGHGDEDRIAGAQVALAAAGDVAAADEAQLRELLGCWAEVLERGPSGPRVVSVTPKASKRVRAETMSAAFETGRAFMVGRHPELEHEATTWQEGQPSPNQLDTLAMGAAHLEQARMKGSVQRPRGAVVPSSVGASPRR